MVRFPQPLASKSYIKDAFRCAAAKLMNESLSGEIKELALAKCLAKQALNRLET